MKTPLSRAGLIARTADSVDPPRPERHFIPLPASASLRWARDSPTPSCDVSVGLAVGYRHLAVSGASTDGHPSG